MIFFITRESIPHSFYFFAIFHLLSDSLLASYSVVRSNLNAHLHFIASGPSLYLSPRDIALVSFACTSSVANLLSHYSLASFMWLPFIPCCCCWSWCEYNFPREHSIAPERAEARKSFSANRHWIEQLGIIETRMAHNLLRRVSHCKAATFFIRSLICTHPPAPRILFLPFSMAGRQAGKRSRKCKRRGNCIKFATNYFSSTRRDERSRTRARKNEKKWKVKPTIISCRRPEESSSGLNWIH